MRHSVDTPPRWNPDRTRQHLIGMKSFVLVLAFLLAACSSSTHHTATPPTMTTVRSIVQPITTAITPPLLVGSWRPVSISGYHGPLTDPPLKEVPVLRFNDKGGWTGNDSCND